MSRPRAAVGAVATAVSGAIATRLPDGRRAAPPRDSAEISRSRIPYLPGLDGLRAIGVIAVLLYHANADWLPGGFLGVEMFFVVSGYLITSILLSERSEIGSNNLKAFWLRRARRA